MSHSAALASFDPLATHPFTNNSGLMPKPAPPSKYPHPVHSVLPNRPAPSSNHPSAHGGLPMHAPQPKRSSPASKPAPTTRGPIFVPFRPERSSPELDDILLKKKVADVLTNNKQPWSMDQARAPKARTSN